MQRRPPVNKKPYSQRTGSASFSQNGSSQGRSGASFGRPAHSTSGSRFNAGGNQGGDKPRYGRPANSDDRRPSGATDGARPRYIRPANSDDRRPSGATDGARPRYGRPANSDDRSHSNTSDGAKPRFESRSKFGSGNAMNRGGANHQRPSFSSENRGGFRPVKPVGSPVRPVQAKPEAAGIARRIALDVLTDVNEHSAFSTLALDKRMDGRVLQPADKRLASNIVYTTLDNKLYLDYVIDAYCEDKREMPPKIREILRLSLCQLIYMDRVPQHAVTDEAVKLARAVGESFTGFTNAIIRAYLREPEKAVLPSPDTDWAKYASIKYSFDVSLVARLEEELGRESAEQLMSFRQREHYTTVRQNLIYGDDTKLQKFFADNGIEAKSGMVPNAFRVSAAENLSDTPAYKNGEYSIQGETSMLAVQALSLKNGMQVLDACAAPGGKACYAAEIMHGTGRVYAWDIYEHRVNLIRASARRLHLEECIRPAVRDACQVKPDMVKSMDAVILDAPCSGLGVIDQKPEIKYHYADALLEELHARQAKLLETVSGYVKRGGALVYSTCSVLPSENEKQVEAFLAAHKEFQAEQIDEKLLSAFPNLEKKLGVQFSRSRDGVDGFYIALLRRKEN